MEPLVPGLIMLYTVYYCNTLIQLLIAVNLRWETLQAGSPSQDPQGVI